jgi:hypothetical protein
MEDAPLIKSETVERNDQFKLLEQLDGFKKLSSKQQQLIRLSLYVQQRAVRGTDAGSADNLGVSDETGDIFVNFPKETDESNFPIENQYRISQQQIYDWYCHAAVTGLEKEVMDKKVFYETDVPKLLNKNGYEIRSEADITDFIEVALESVEMPAVLHVLADGVPYHSAILLGKDDTGEYILWEKKGFSIPYQLTTLKDVYSTYDSHNQEWLVRPINKTELQNEE